MRAISVIVAGAALASCSTAPPMAPTRTAAKQVEFQQLLAGKVAQRPISCLPHYYANDMRIIDDNTVVFRQGGSRVYVAHLNGGCSGLGGGGNTLVTRQFGTADLCSGQIATVVDPVSHVTVGSCAFENFQPFVRPGA
ncbi:MAG: hypothetical protein ACTHKE_04495 [Sphingomicrobium sp.]|jgi:hypothetical protein